MSGWRPPDPVRVADADRSRPLTIRGPAAPFTCVFCGARQEPFAWRVTVAGFGVACPGCAADHGWDVR